MFFDIFNIFQSFKNSKHTIKSGPPNFDAVKDFDTSAYLGKWFVQEQQEIRYLPLKRNHAVTAEYSEIPQGIKVVNSARDDSLQGEKRGAELLAIVKDPSCPSKLAVGPTWLPNFLRGPYWVVAISPINPTSRLYDWAIITGGVPLYQNTENGLWSCRNSNPFNLNGSGEGLWLFTREAHVPQEHIDMMRKIAQDLGLDTTILNKVDHEGGS